MGILAEVWSFIQEPNNRATIGWIAGGVVTLTGAAWAVVKFALSGRAAGSPIVTAIDHSKAAGRDINEAPSPRRERTK